MLITGTPIESLTEDQRRRLALAARLLLNTNEATTGFVMWEGKHIKTEALRALLNGPRVLREDL